MRFIHLEKNNGVSICDFGKLMQHPSIIILSIAVSIIQLSVHCKKDENDPLLLLGALRFVNTSSQSGVSNVSSACTTSSVPANCAVDADLDGILDCYEVSGSTFQGLNLYAMGARTGQQDIFIEIDYMNSTDPGVTPRKEALANVTTAFATKGIVVHFDVGSLYSTNPGNDPANYDLGGGGLVLFSKGITIGSVSGLANLYDYKAQYFDPCRKSIFHYAIFGYTQNAAGSAGSSGLGEIDGNDLLVTLGNWGLTTTPGANLNMLINFQASTLMHELGHNLGLRHGGNENNNYKPNYFSIMNYMYQLYGLSTIGNVTEGDRYYLTYGCLGYTLLTQLTNDPTKNTFKMDYSDGTGAALNESNVNETAGLGRTGSAAVDYNCGGTTNNGYAQELDWDSVTDTSITDYNDWGNLHPAFQQYYNGSSGSSLQTNHMEQISNDFHPVIEELPPPPQFFQNLKKITDK